MAESSTIALNLGSQRISMAAFSNKGGKITLNKYAQREILADPVLDATRGPKVTAAIADLTKELKTPKAAVRYALSGAPVITRFVKLPPLDDDNVDQLVKFEAQQVIPLSLDEIVWDYKMLETGGLDKEVALFAIKGEQLEDIHDSVVSAGVSSRGVDVAPSALYNAFRYNYGTLDETVLLVDIGARSTNLLYIEGGRFFARTSNVGGASITAAIAKGYGINFSEAEGQKVGNGMVALGGGHTSQLDEATGALATAIRNAFSKLPADISRTTNLFRSQHGGSAPTRVLIAGGGANLTYTKEFFEEKLNLPVEVFNPLQRVAVGKGVDPAVAQASAHQMGELVGLAVQDTGKAALEIDLVPGAVADQRADDKRKPVVLAAAAITLAALGAWAFFQKKDKEASDAKVAEIQQVVDSGLGASNVIKKLQEQEKGLNARTGMLATAEAGRSFPVNLLRTITNGATSQFYWITDISPIVGYNPLDPNKAGQPIISDNFGKNKHNTTIVNQISGRDANTVNAIRLTGFWRENPKGNTVVFEIIENLKKSKSGVFKFTAPDPRTTQEKPLEDKQLVKSSAVSDDTTYAWPFEIILPLANPMPLK